MPPCEGAGVGAREHQGLVLTDESQASVGL